MTARRAHYPPSIEVMLSSPPRTGQPITAPPSEPPSAPSTESFFNSDSPPLGDGQVSRARAPQLCRRCSAERSCTVAQGQPLSKYLEVVFATDHRPTYGAYNACSRSQDAALLTKVTFENLIEGVAGMLNSNAAHAAAALARMCPGGLLLPSSKQLLDIVTNGPFGDFLGFGNALFYSRDGLAVASMGKLCEAASRCRQLEFARAQLEYNGVFICLPALALRELQGLAIEDVDKAAEEYILKINPSEDSLEFLFAPSRVHLACVPDNDYDTASIGLLCQYFKYANVRLSEKGAVRLARKLLEVARSEGAKRTLRWSLSILIINHKGRAPDIHVGLRGMVDHELYYIAKLNERSLAFNAASGNSQRCPAGDDSHAYWQKEVPNDKPYSPICYSGKYAKSFRLGCGFFPYGSLYGRGWALMSVVQNLADAASMLQWQPFDSEAVCSIERYLNWAPVGAGAFPAAAQAFLEVKQLQFSVFHAFWNSTKLATLMAYLGAFTGPLAASCLAFSRKPYEESTYDYVLNGVLLSAGGRYDYGGFLVLGYQSISSLLTLAYKVVVQDADASWGNWPRSTDTDPITPVGMLNEVERTVCSVTGKANLVFADDHMPESLQNFEMCKSILGDSRESVTVYRALVKSTKTGKPAAIVCVIPFGKYQRTHPEQIKDPAAEVLFKQCKTNAMKLIVPGRNKWNLQLTGFPLQRSASEAQPPSKKARH